MFFRCRLDLLAAFKGYVSGSHDESVRFADLVIGNEPLKVPRGVGRSTTGRRLSEPDAVLLAKHQHVRHAVADAVIPWRGVNVPRRMVDQRQ